MPPLDIAIRNAQAEAKRSGKRQSILRVLCKDGEYYFTPKALSWEKKRIVVEVNVTEVPIFIRVP